MLTIEPWDKSCLRGIEAAILASDLGITPSNDGSMIRLPFPALTEERRKEMVKQCKVYAEEGRVAVRNARRDGNAKIERLKKDSEHFRRRCTSRRRADSEAHGQIHRHCRRDAARRKKQRSWKSSSSVCFSPAWGASPISPSFARAAVLAAGLEMHRLGRPRHADGGCVFRFISSLNPQNSHR